MLRTTLGGAVLLSLTTTLAACDGADTGTSISFSGNGSDGNSVATMDGSTGQVKVDVPGFQGSFKLPKIQFTADNFDLNGVKLYPGSTISAFNVDSRGKEDGQVRVSFDSPAAPATVRDWFAQRLPKAGYKVRTDGAGLTGTTDEDKPFALKLDDKAAAGVAAAGHAKGTIVIG